MLAAYSKGEGKDYLRGKRSVLAGFMGLLSFPYLRDSATIYFYMGANVIKISSARQIFPVFWLFLRCSRS